MDPTAAVSAAAAGLNSNAGSAIAVSVLRMTENAAATQASILLSSLGIGRNFSAFA